MKRSKEQTLETIENLLDSALKVFFKKGYSKTTLEDIAKEANLTRGAFYWHFETKKDIYDKIVKREDDFINDLLNKSYNENMNPIEKLENTLFIIITNFYDNKRFRDFVELTWFRIEQDFTSVANQNKLKANENFIKYINDTLLKAQNIGHLDNNINTYYIALQIDAVINGIYRLSFFSPEIYTKENALNILNQYFQFIIK